MIQPKGKSILIISILVSLIINSCSRATNNEEKNDDIKKRLLSGGSISTSCYLDFPLNTGEPLQIKLNINNKSYLFLLDTGSEITIISKNAKCFTLEPEKTNILTKGIAGNSQKNSFAKLDPIQLKDVVIEDVYCAVTDLSHIEINGLKYDGILGENFLSNFILTIDYSRKKFTLTNIQSDNLNKGDFIPFDKNEFISGNHFYAISDNGKDIPIFIDTGIDLSCTPDSFNLINHSFYNNHLELLGINNIGIPYELGKVENLTIGNALVNDLTVVKTNKDRFLLGRDFLERSKVEIDYITKRIRFDKFMDQNTFTQVVHFSEIVIEKNSLGFIIKEIWDKSKLVQKGIRVGDHIKEINNISLSEFQSVIDLYITLTDSRIYSITYEREEEVSIEIKNL
ncbi:retroviral-like aspartic protease family protein [Spirochaeta isovalerica]|uniref:Putative aspartyl protease n=1 Tax=Spirochaeta isovalerica TaxID=150 RepID=A0A841RA73_9SPIO|nr:aspartyl protease family protein [Spirochaeta isovalerica]MBB6479598.1 putative aspartyl protease [Spirochaeta isovalerica]